MTAPAPLTIQQLRAELGVTSRALRFWEAQGLLASARDNAGSGRVYDAVQQARAHRIVRLRRMRFSLSDILDLLALEAAGDDGAPAATRLRMLKARSDALAAEADEIAHARRLVLEERNALHGIEARADAPAEPRPVLIEGEAHAWPA